MIKKKNWGWLNGYGEVRGTSFFEEKRIESWELQLLSRGVIGWCMIVEIIDSGLIKVRNSAKEVGLSLGLSLGLGKS